MIGVNKKGLRLDKVGLDCSLVKSFKASAKGWGNPAIPTLLGPLRIWAYPNTLRSSSVKKAIPSKTATNEIKILIKGEKVIDF